MFSGSFSILFLFAIGLYCTEASYQCARAIGKLVCRRDSSLAAKAIVEMLDDDGGNFWNADDPMGVATVKDDGSFSVEGCAKDAFFDGDPDPYLKITHKCTLLSGGWNVHKTEHKYTFTPNVADYGTIYLDD